LEALVEQGPDPVRDGVVRWRRIDLQAVLKPRFGVQLHERSVGKVRRRLGFTHLSVRPKPPASARRSRSGCRTTPAWASRAP
jgi:transposase